MEGIPVLDSEGKKVGIFIEEIGVLAMAGPTEIEVEDGFTSADVDEQGYTLKSSEVLNLDDNLIDLISQAVISKDALNLRAPDIMRMLE